MDEMILIKRADTNALLDDAVAVSRKWEAALGDGKKGRAEKAFTALRKGRLELGNPEGFAHRLTEKEFTDQGVDLSAAIKRSMRGDKGYNYYLLPVPLLLFPGRGAQYRLVESQLKIIGGKKEREVAIFRIFPQPEWVPVLDWGGSLNLALDAGLDWGAEVSQVEAKLATLEGELAGRVYQTNKSSSFIRVYQYEHSLGRMEIEAQHTDRRAMWRLDSKKVIRGQKQTRTVLLVKVPKEIGLIRLEAAAQAEVSFDWLTAQVNHVFARLSEKLQSIIEQRKGLPLQDFATWDIQLPH